MEFITNSPEETEKIGEKLAKALPAGTILAYRGDLGAGKTAFTRGLARGLGASEPVTSSYDAHRAAWINVNQVNAGNRQ